MFRVEFWIVSTLFCCGVIAGLVLSWPDSTPAPAPAAEESEHAGPEDHDDHSEHADPNQHADVKTNSEKLLRSLAFDLGLDEELSLEETESRLLRSADQYMLLGNYNGALKLIRSILQSEQSHPDPVVLCRLALAEELRGNYSLAEKAYLQAIKRPTSRSIEVLNLAGLARVWLMNRKPSEAIELLSDIVLQSSRFETGSAFLDGEVLSLLATAQRQIALSGRAVNPFSVDGVEFSSPAIDLEQTIDVLQANSTPKPMLASTEPVHATEGHAGEGHEGEQHEEPPTAENASGLQVLARESDQAEAITLAAQLEVTPLMTLLEQLGAATGLKFEFDDAAPGMLKGRSKSLHFDKLNFGTVLDAMLGSIRLGWSQDGSTIRISALAQDQESAAGLAAANRTWQQFLQNVPRDRRTAFARFEQGNLRLMEKQYDEAAAEYQAALQAGARDDMAAKIHLNQARLNAALGRMDEAVALLYRAIDTASNKHVAALAYFLISQFQLQLGELDESLAATSRSISLSQEEPLTTQAVLQQTRIYLLQNKPFAANQAIFQQRQLFNENPEKVTAGFLGSLSRFLGSELPEARRNESYRLVSFMDELQSSPAISTIDRYLIGRAWQNLGFDDKALGQLETAIAGCTETYWRERLLFELAIQHQRHRDYEEAIRCYQHLARAGNLETATTAKIQILEAQLELRQFPEAIATGRELLAAKLAPEQQKSVLTSLGLAYRQIGEPYAAALCFAGMLPQENLQK
jgi:tetratricopeptide (TPR) repeat protein